MGKVTAGKGRAPEGRSTIEEGIGQVSSKYRLGFVSYLEPRIPERGQDGKNTCANC
jgi:hypothetical protein